MSPSKAAETIIEEAMRRGEFEDLPGFGKPLDLSAYFDTPEEVRLAYSILKNADVLPREAERLKEIAALKKELASCQDEERSQGIEKSIQEKLLWYNILMDAQNKGRKRLDFSAS